MLRDEDYMELYFLQNRITYFAVVEYNVLDKRVRFIASICAIRWVFLCFIVRTAWFCPLRVKHALAAEGYLRYKKIKEKNLHMFKGFCNREINYMWLVYVYGCLLSSVFVLTIVCDRKNYFVCVHILF